MPSSKPVHRGEMTSYRVAKSYSVTGGVSNISLEFETTEPRIAQEWDLTGVPVPPFPSSARAELERNTRELEEGLETDIVEFERTIGAAVDDLNAAVRLLDAAIREKKRTVKRNRATLAPIRRLPPEILRHILINAGLFFLPKAGKGLVSMMLVCKTWYHTVLDTPHFWTRFDLSSYHYSEHRQNFLQYALARANPFPLDLRITIAESFSSLNANKSLLKQMVSRSSSLDLQFHTYYEGWDFYEEIDCIFEAIVASKLVHFTMSVRNDEAPYDRHIHLQNFLTESSAVQQPLSHMQHHLQSLEMVHVDFLPNELRMPRLEKLKLNQTCFDNAHLRKWTTVAPNLLHLDIQEIFSTSRDHWDDFTTPTLVFQRLHHLELSQLGSEARAEAILAACPFIQTLLIFTFDLPTSIQLRVMQSLNRLAIAYVTPEIPEGRLYLEHLVKWFNCMPNLECLEISESDDTGTSVSGCALFITVLTGNVPNISNTDICPRLTSLIYTAKFDGTQSDEVITKYVDCLVALSRSRQGGKRCCGLKTTFIYEYYAPNTNRFQGRVTIAKDADYLGLLQALHVEPEPESPEDSSSPVEVSNSASLTL